jgi:hypothetical protein
MKIVVTHYDDERPYYVKELEYMYNDPIRVFLTSCIDYAHDYNIEPMGEFSLLFTKVSESLKRDKNVKSVNLYDKTYIRNLKIQKIKKSL